MFSDLPQWVKDEFDAGKNFSRGWESFYFLECNVA